MGAEKIAAFYDDETKAACDAQSAAKAHYLRALSTRTGLSWQALRIGKFLGQYGVGVLRETRGRLSARSQTAPGEAARISQR